ncbi:hypothetical protein B0T13DRAFT_19902 [Neurospora crassa]|nr:hypothetical protein B0T13DRAFT_19902 [Neurospora crassa]
MLVQQKPTENFQQKFHKRAMEALGKPPEPDDIPSRQHARTHFGSIQPHRVHRRAERMSKKEKPEVKKIYWNDCMIRLLVQTYDLHYTCTYTVKSLVVSSPKYSLKDQKDRRETNVLAPTLYYITNNTMRTNSTLGMGCDERISTTEKLSQDDHLQHTWSLVYVLTNSFSKATPRLPTYTFEALPALNLLMLKRPADVSGQAGIT